MCPLQGANTVTLKRQRSLWEGDREVVKRSGRDEPIGVVIHMCVEAVLGISLYGYPYLKLAKMSCLSYCLCLLFKKNWRRGQNRFCLGERGVGWEREEVEGKGEEVAQTMYAHMNK
jgi:hypothetical protein